MYTAFCCQMYHPLCMFFSLL
uniref:Uncharacterized protein n=1 Tax=Anguilla anguilla TaxID=7936 RepID=A0A0E9V881_ANGAN